MMLGKNIQPTATLLDRKKRRNGGFSLRKNHGIEVPITPAAAVSAMTLTERKTIVVHESVYEGGTWHVREAIIAAARHPVTMSDHVSVDTVLPGPVSAIGSFPQNEASPLEFADLAIDAEAGCGWLIAGFCQNSMLHS
jgi:hypothetical protein